MARIALIDQAQVQAVIVADLDFARDAHPDLLAVPLWADEPVGPGWLYRAHEVPRFANPLDQPDPISVNWDQFRAEISAHHAYLRLASATPQNLALNSLITALLWQVGSRPELLAEVAIKWNLMVDDCPLVPDEVAALNEIAQRCGLPLRLDEGGRIE